MTDDAPLATQVAYAAAEDKKRLMAEIKRLTAERDKLAAQQQTGPCPVCWTSSWSPADAAGPDAEQLKDGSWVRCDCCAMTRWLVEKNKEIERLKEEAKRPVSKEGRPMNRREGRRVQASELLKEIQDVVSKFGDTCFYVTGLAWGSVALWQQSDYDQSATKGGGS